MAEPPKAFYDALRFIYPQWLPEAVDTNYRSLTPALFKKHFDQLSRKYGFTIRPSQPMLTELAYYLLSDTSKTNDVIGFLEMLKEDYPPDFKLYDTLGDCFARKGDTENAISNYRAALVLDPQSRQTQEKLKALNTPRKKAL